MTVRELLAIRHKMPKDNTDMLVLCARDPLFGDIYIFKHLINIYHDYHFNGKTFRVLVDPRPDLIDGEPPPGRHRDVAVLQAWIEHLTTWTGGPPILIMHFHGDDEDQQLDEDQQRSNLKNALVAAARLRRAERAAGTTKSLEGNLRCARHTRS